MAKVYLALVAGPADVHKLLVVKVVKDDVLAGCDDAVELFWDEARLASRLLHPNIVHTYEVGEIQGRYVLAMEYLEGQSYRTVQRRNTSVRLPLQEELRILSETARGLHYAHTLGDFEGRPMSVVHRDVSPHNVFLTYDGQVKLLDFGIAKTLDASHHTTVGMIKGKLDYIAPEQLRGDAVDARADVFSLGVMLWEAVAGRRFAGGPQVAEATKMRLRLSAGEPKIRAVAPEVPDGLAAIVEHAVALDPDARFQDAASLADALDAYLEWSGQTPSAKRLAAFMRVAFADDRRTMQQRIERQMQAMKREAVELGQSGPLPRLASAQSQSVSGAWARHGQPELATAGHAAGPVESVTVAVGGPSLRRAGRLVAATTAALALVGVTAAATVGIGVLVLPPLIMPASSPPAVARPAAASGAPAAAPPNPDVQPPVAGSPRPTDAEGQAMRTQPAHVDAALRALDAPMPGAR